MTATITERQVEYTPAELLAGLRQVGLARGDTVYVQPCIHKLGPATGYATREAEARMWLAALHEVLGDEGTLLIPTYSFSFCRHEVFDVRETPAVPGPWSSFGELMETFRRDPGVIRSADPIFSVAGRGPEAVRLLTRPSNSCLGVDSIHDRLRRLGGKICLIGEGLFESTFRHHIEEMAEVPWRFQKLFTGQVREGATLRREGRLYNVRILASNGDPAGERLEERARALGLCRVAPLGGAEIVAIDAQAYYDLGMQALRDDPWYTAKGPPGDPIALEDARVGAVPQTVALPPHAGMMDMIERLWRLPRDIVSDGYDTALRALATQLPMTIHEYPSGTECWSWVIPEKWTCHEAYLETLAGRRLFSYADHPLHVVSYSLPFDGVVPREVLLRHLHVHPVLPDAVPFQFRYYDRDWGLCCTQQQKAALTDEAYRVVIRSSTRFGTLKVGEVVVPGRSEESIVLCAHLCHPSMVNDDLAGVVVGMKVMETLRQRSDLRYTYRLLILPESIGSNAWLSHNEPLIPLIRGGLFLEMLGLEQPHALQRSLHGDTEFDRCFAHVMRRRDPSSWVGDFRQVIGNDERMFNAPGLRIPMLSLSRVMPPPALPFPQYHSSADSPAIAHAERLEESVALVLEMLAAIERNVTPVPRLKGELFCSRYGLHIDWYTDPEANQSFFDVLYLVDGTRSVADIAVECRLSIDAVWRIVDQLLRHDLVVLRDTARGWPAPVPVAGGRER